MEKLLTAGQVAEILNVSMAWVYDHAERKRPQLPSVRLGKAVRFRPTDIERFIQEMSRFAAECKPAGACYDGPRLSARH
jgi:excisionase family DNA binding protein